MRAARLVLLLSFWTLSTSCEWPDTEAYVVALEKMARVVEENQEDCDAMGRALGHFLRNQGAPIRVYNEHDTRLTKRERAVLEGPKYRPRVQRAMARLLPGHQRCMTNDSVRKAFIEL